MKTNRSLTGGPALPANATCNPQLTAALESCARPSRWWMLCFTAAISLTLGLASLHAAAPLQYNGDYLGGRLIYDPNTDLTWYQAPYANVNWSVAMDWAANLTVGGTTGWRLPSIDPATVIDNGSQLFVSGNLDDGELAYLWYDELGNQTGTLTNSGPFDPTIWQSAAYWTSSGPWYAHLSGFAVYFSTGGGSYGLATIPPWTPGLGAEIAVHAGDIGPNGPVTPPLGVATTVGNKIVLCWPASGANCVLQTCTNLCVPCWEDCPDSPVVTGGQCMMTNTPSGNPVFYRLRTP